MCSKTMTCCRVLIVLSVLYFGAIIVPVNAENGCGGSFIVYTGVYENHTSDRSGWSKCYYREYIVYDCCGNVLKIVAGATALQEGSIICCVSSPGYLGGWGPDGCKGKDNEISVSQYTNGVIEYIPCSNIQSASWIRGTGLKIVYAPTASPNSPATTPRQGTKVDNTQSLPPIVRGPQSSGGSPLTLTPDDNWKEVLAKTAVKSLISGIKRKKKDKGEQKQQEAWYGQYSQPLTQPQVVQEAQKDDAFSEIELPDHTNEMAFALDEIELPGNERSIPQGKLQDEIDLDNSTDPVHTYSDDEREASSDHSFGSDNTSGLSSQAVEVEEFVDNLSKSLEVMESISDDPVTSKIAERARSAKNYLSGATTVMAISDYLENPGDVTKEQGFLEKSWSFLIEAVTAPHSVGVDAMPKFAFDVLPRTYDAALQQTLETFKSDGTYRPEAVLAPACGWLKDWVIPVGK